MNEINIQSLKLILLNNGVEFAGIFGSRARGDNKPDSDLDVLVRFKKDDVSLLKFIHLENTLSDTLGIKVDLVTEEALSPYIRDSVLSSLKVILNPN